MSDSASQIHPISEDLSSKSPSFVESQVNSVDATLERKTIRQVDWRILPLLGILFSIAQVDRSNLGIARTLGMGSDLGLDMGSRYSIVSSMYFIPYILLQLPGTLAMRAVGVRNWITLIVFLFGVDQVAMAFAPNWKILILCRVLLGALEASLYPSLVFIIQTWYLRGEVQKRLAAFYVTSVVVVGFSNLFAYGVSNALDGKHGMGGWRWVFILEGAITVFLGVVAFFFVPSFPHNSTFLTSEQTELVLKRVEDDRGDSLPDDIAITFTSVLRHYKDWKIWAWSIMFMCATMPAYAIVFFMSTILNGMGWSVRDSLILSTPPYLFTAALVLLLAYFSDRLRQRGIFIALNAILTIVGLSLTAYAPSSGWKYCGCFLIGGGSSGCMVGIIAYVSNNVRSHTTRAVTSATVTGFGGLGGILATETFRQADYPRYIPGLWTTMGCQFLMLGLLGLTTLHFSRCNAKTRRNVSEGLLDNRSPFYYTL